jgi:outer membrane protein assembly factor BamC
MNLNPLPLSRLALAAAAAAALAGCSSVENLLAGDKLDYRTQSERTAPLEVPPDLTQLARDTRYQPVSGTVSASALAASPQAGAVAAAVAPAALGDVQVQRAGNQRWLKTRLSPEQLWPQLRGFWQDRGFAILHDSADAGVMETDWAENRAKIPMDGIRRALGWILESFYSTSERDKFRTRVERVDGGTEIFISHRGMEEVLQGQAKDQTTWRPRAADPQLEAEMLARLMVRLGAKEEVARAAVAQAPVAPARARLVAGQAGGVEVDEAFDRAWRRVGLALDRSGFTVEDRDRNAGIYYVRYVDPKAAAAEEPGFFSRLFSSDKAGGPGPQRYRVALKAAGDKTQVAVADAQGQPARADVAQRIATLLVDELK